MKMGMMWDYGTKNKKDKHDLKTIIIKVSEYYKEKYNRYPDTCHINLNADKVDDVIETEKYKIKVIKDKTILLNNLWIGLKSE